MSKKFYNFIYRHFQPFVRSLYRIDIKGAENEPPSGPCIVCANHISNHDVLILAASMKRQVRYLAKAELFRVPLLSALIRALGAFPLKRGGGDVAALRTTIALVNEGELVGMFPQGHRRPGVDPASTQIQHGLGMLLWRTKAKVLPVAICGKKMKVGFFRKTVVSVGEPISFDSLAMTAGNPEEYRRVTETVFKKITDMVKENAAFIGKPFNSDW